MCGELGRLKHKAEFVSMPDLGALSVTTISLTAAARNYRSEAGSWCSIGSAKFTRAKLSRENGIESTPAAFKNRGTKGAVRSIGLSAPVKETFETTAVASCLSG